MLMNRGVPMTISPSQIQISGPTVMRAPPRPRPGAGATRPRGVWRIIKTADSGTAR